MATIAKLNVILGLTDNAFTKGIDSARNKIDSLAQSTRQIGAALTAGVTVPVIGAGLAITKMASDLDNTMQSTKVVFKEASNEVISFADTAATSFGLSKQEALDFSLGFSGMLLPIADSKTELAGMSTELVSLTADFGAFWNLNNEEAFIVMQSALAGETEAIRRYGVDVSAATVETKALELGLADTTAELTEQDKMLARYHLILEQTTEEQGAFARESDSVAGKLKTQTARFKDMATELGMRLLPVASRVLDFVEDLLDGLDSLSPAMQKWVLIIAAAAAALGPLLIAIGFMLPGLSLMLGLFAALLSPIGLVIAAAGVLAFLFRDDIANAIQAVVDRVQFAINIFQNLMDSGLEPLQALTRTLITLFPQFTGVIVPLVQAVRDVIDAFRDFSEGQFHEAFDALGRAAGNVWQAIQFGITMIDWGGIASALWSGIQGAAAWVGSQVLEIPSLVVSIGGWLFEQVGDLWGQLKATIYGWLGGGGTVGQIIGAVNTATGTTPDIPIGTLTLAIAGWAFQAAQNIYDRLKSWILGQTGAVVTLASIAVAIGAWAIQASEPVADAVERFVVGSWGLVTSIPEVLLSILRFDPSYNGTAVDILIENMIGEVLVTLSRVLVQITSFEFDTPSVQGLLQAAVPLIVGATVLAAVPISVPILLVLGTIAVGTLVSLVLWQWAADWARVNPIKAVEVLTNIVIAVGEITEDLPSADELKEMALSFIGLPEDGFIRISVGVILDFFEGDTSSDLEQKASAAGQGIFGGGGKGFDMEQLSGRSMIQGLDSVRTAIATALDSVKTDTIQPKVAEWGTAMAAGLQPLSAIAGAAFAGISGTIGAHLGAATATVSAQTGMMLGVAAANFTGMQVAGTTSVMALGASVIGSIAGTAAGWGAQLAGMLGSATSNFVAMRATGTSNTAAMSASVGATMANMASTSKAHALGMQVGVAASALIMRNQSVSNAQSMASGVGAAMAGMGVAVRASVSSAFGAIPGIIASAGGAAIGTARSIGAQIGQGVAAGMYSALGSIAAAANAIIMQANAAMIAAAMIRSPSRLTRPIGRYLGLGPVEGIYDILPSVARAGRDYIGAFADAMTPTSGLAFSPALGSSSPFAANVRHVAGGGLGNQRPIQITITNNITQQPGEDGEALAQRATDMTLERLHGALVATGGAS